MSPIFSGNNFVVQILLLQEKGTFSEASNWEARDHRNFIFLFCSEGRSADILQDVYYRFVSVDVDIDVNINFYLNILASSVCFFFCFCFLLPVDKKCISLLL